MMSLIVSTVPFLSMIAMNYIQDGKEINFGLARGMGSISYAVSAVLLGLVSFEFFNPYYFSICLRHFCNFRFSNFIFFAKYQC